MEKIRILLADDHVVVREGTRQLLEREPDLVVVGEAGDGEEAVRLAGELNPDIIIMDVAMPKLSGIEATKLIKHRQPSVAVIVLTGYDSEEYLFGLLDSGAAGYLLKDISGDELVRAIRAVHAGEPVLHPSAIKKLVTRYKTQITPPVETPSTEPLTEREKEVLNLAAKGQSNKEIGEALLISVRTVQAHMRSIFNKLGVGSRSEAVVHGLKAGWFNLEDISS